MRQSRKLTEQEIETIFSLRSEGWSTHNIAKYLHCGDQIVTGFLKDHDLPKLQSGPKTFQPDPEEKIISFEPLEIELIYNLKAEGLDLKQISDRTGRKEEEIQYLTDKIGAKGFLYKPSRRLIDNEDREDFDEKEKFDDYMSPDWNSIQISRYIDFHNIGEFRSMFSSGASLEEISEKFKIHPHIARCVAGVLGLCPMPPGIPSPEWIMEDMDLHMKDPEENMLVKSMLLLESYEDPELSSIIIENEDVLINHKICNEQGKGIIFDIAIPKLRTAIVNTSSEEEREEFRKKIKDGRILNEMMRSAGIDRFYYLDSPIGDNNNLKQIISHTKDRFFHNRNNI